MKLSLAFFFDRRFFASLLLVLLIAAYAAAEGHVAFASSLGGTMSPKGLPGYGSSPARLAEPSFGVAGYWMDDVDEYALGASGEMKLDSCRLAFFYAFQAMDSLYRSSYAELQLSWHRKWLLLGGAYGVNVEWMPGESLWARHRAKFAFDLNWRGFWLGGMLDGFTDGGLEKRVGLFWDGGENLRLFAESDFEKFSLGFDFLWKRFSLRTSYNFPDFAVAVSVGLNFDVYGLFYAHGFAANSLGWNGAGVCRRIKK